MNNGFIILSYQAIKFPQTCSCYYSKHKSKQIRVKTYSSHQYSHEDNPCQCSCNKVIQNIQFYVYNKFLLSKSAYTHKHNVQTNYS